MATAKIKIKPLVWEDTIKNLGDSTIAGYFKLVSYDIYSYEVAWSVEYCLRIFERGEPVKEERGIKSISVAKRKATIHWQNYIKSILPHLINSDL